MQMMTAIPRLSLTIGPFHRQFFPHSHKMAAEIPFLTFYQNQGKRGNTLSSAPAFLTKTSLGLTGSDLVTWFVPELQKEPLF